MSDVDHSHGAWQTAVSRGGTVLSRWLAGALTACAAALPAVGQTENVLFATGFEAPAYATGPIGGGYYSLPQFTSASGWYAWPLVPYSADPSPWALVTDQKAAAGSQSLKLSIDPASNSQISISRTMPSGMTSPGGSGSDRFGISLRLYIDQAADSDVTWSMGLADSYAALLGISFTPSGQLMYAHRSMSTAALFNTGFQLRNTWLDVTIEANPTDPSSVLLTISGRGQTWQQAVGSPGGLANRFYMGGAYPSFPLYKSGTAYVDDLRIGYNLTPIPEPARGATVLALGLLAFATRRRRHD